MTRLESEFNICTHRKFHDDFFKTIRLQIYIRFRRQIYKINKVTHLQIKRCFFFYLIYYFLFDTFDGIELSFINNI